MSFVLFRRPYSRRDTFFLQSTKLFSFCRVGNMKVGFFRRDKPTLLRKI
jgi:hypothetical protein